MPELQMIASMGDQDDHQSQPCCSWLKPYIGIHTYTHINIYTYTHMHICIHIYIQHCVCRRPGAAGPQEIHKQCFQQQIKPQDILINYLCSAWSNVNYGFIRPASVKQEKDSFDEGLIIVYEHQIYMTKNAAIWFHMVQVNPINTQVWGIQLNIE